MFFDWPLLLFDSLYNEAPKFKKIIVIIFNIPLSTSYSHAKESFSLGLFCAQEQFITIIPEIEMPGHAQAALAAYPELACT
ncbi:MAG: family 20 glycosylhydrolase, partial [Phaeodactylibacter sp.]|nr:family 20 glycosylhydrolase [Phaeodactylibacter sp.]